LPDLLTPPERIGLHVGNRGCPPLAQQFAHRRQRRASQISPRDTDRIPDLFAPGRRVGLHIGDDVVPPLAQLLPDRRQPTGLKRGHQLAGLAVDRLEGTGGHLAENRHLFLDAAQVLLPRIAQQGYSRNYHGDRGSHRQKPADHARQCRDDRLQQNQPESGHDILELDKGHDLIGNSGEQRLDGLPDPGDNRAGCLEGIGDHGHRLTHRVQGGQGLCAKHGLQGAGQHIGLRVRHVGCASHAQALLAFPDGIQVLEQPVQGRQDTLDRCPKLFAKIFQRTRLADGQEQVQQIGQPAGDAIHRRADHLRHGQREEVLEGGLQTGQGARHTFGSAAEVGIGVLREGIGELLPGDLARIDGRIEVLTVLNGDPVFLSGKL